MINNFDCKIKTFSNTSQTIFSRPLKEVLRLLEAVFKSLIHKKRLSKNR